jgi:hypothetical protein
MDTGITVVGIMACTTAAATMADITSAIVAGVISAITVITAAITLGTIAAITAIIGITIHTIAVSGTAAGIRMASPRAGGGRTTTMSSSGSAIELPLTNIMRLGMQSAGPFS